jgi:magnesium-transporting ATPase (P-type)
MADSSDNSQVNIRMVTGDHVDTAKSVAYLTGIVKQEELDIEGCVMTGIQFREMIGPHTKIWDPVGMEYKVEFQNQKTFDDIKRRCKILARASAEDKFILVSGIKQKGGLVGMTGDSIADAEALKRADVGFAMGTGCDVAKDNSDLVILDNRFMSIYRAIKWGRAIFDNVRKFIQFQLTINIVICFMTILGGLTLGRTPLNVIQMLWVNLIMDILGAIAIGTEPYQKEDKQMNRISRKDKIMTPEMWRQIIGHSVYQILVMMILMYFGVFMFFDKTFNLVTAKSYDDDGKQTGRLVLDTILFHTFILLNLFNMINSRVVEAEEINVFKTLFNNILFWIVVGFELFVQQSMLWAGETELGSSLLGLGKLTPGQQAICWAIGSTSLLVNIAVKKIPLSAFAFARHIDLESENKDEFINKLSNSATSQIKGKVGKMIGQKGNVDASPG